LKKLKKTPPVYFSLNPSIFAARHENAVIILDTDNDKYISLVEPAASYLEFICTQEFCYDDDIYHSTFQSSIIEEKFLNHWICDFIQRGYISQTSQKSLRSVSPPPLKSGGLSHYKWDSKSSWKPFSIASKIEIIKAFLILIQIHRLIKKRNLKGVLFEIGKHSHESLIKPSQHELKQLIAAVDAATLIYPKKTFCLIWAATFAILALKKKWDVRFSIGIQTNPFYAHAWVESNGQVINDDHSILEVMSIILKTP
jgi:hypothetical protein